MNKLKPLIIAFLVGIGTSILFIPGSQQNGNKNSEQIQETPPSQIHQCQTNIVQKQSTNQFDRGKIKPNVDWFKSGSNYIWDDWKIK